MNDSPAVPVPRSRGRLLSLFGLAVAVLGVAIYIVQFSLHRLTVPWYMPVLGFLGAGLVTASLSQRRSLWRVLALLVVVLLTGLEIAFLYGMRLPAYTGPIAVGRPFPEFETNRSDGTSFTQRDLTGDRSSVLVFFRGRW